MEVIHTCMNMWAHVLVTGTCSRYISIDIIDYVVYYIYDIKALSLGTLCHNQLVTIKF